MINTRVNYDILYYLPEEIETMKGQDILVDQFGTGSFSMFYNEFPKTIHIHSSFSLVKWPLVISFIQLYHKNDY